MALSALPQFIMQLHLLPPHGDTVMMDQVLEPSLKAEERLREAFSRHRDDPRLLDLHIGITDVFKLPLTLRSIRSRYGFNNAVDSSWAKSHIFPLTSDKRRPYDSPTVVDSLETFQLNFDIFSSGVLRYIDWSNVVVAGGAILASLQPPPQNIVDEHRLGEYYHETHYKRSDIDLFLHGLSDAEVCSYFHHRLGFVNHTVIGERETVTNLLKYSAGRQL